MMRRLVVGMVAMLLNWLQPREQLLARREIYGLLTGREKNRRTTKKMKVGEGMTVEERFNRLLKNRGIRSMFTKEEVETRRAFMGRRVTGVSPTGRRLELADGQVAPTFFVQSEPVVVHDQQLAKKIEAENSLKLNELGRDVRNASGLPLVLADPLASLEDAIEKGEHLEFDPGSSGVKYENGEVYNMEHNTRFIPISLRGQQYDHGLVLQALKESGTLRRGWSTINQILSSGLWNIDPADLGEDATEAEIEAAEEQAEFIRRWQKQIHGGWRKFIREAMYQALAGPAVFVEVFWPQNSERAGMVKKLAFRFPNTIKSWILDENEQELLAVEFINPDGSTYVVDAKHLLVYSYDQLGTDFEGMGIVRTIFVWLEILQLFSQLEAVAAEKFGSPWVWASKENPALEHGASDDEMDELTEVIEAAIAAENPIIVLPDNSKIEMTSPAGQMPNFAEPKRFALERLSELLKSEASMIGTGATGAFAARESAVDEQTAFAPVFGDIICEGINGVGSAPYTGTIAKMIDARFGGPVRPDMYPTMTFQLGDFEDPDRVNKVIQAKREGLVKESPELIEHMHDALGLPAPIFEEEEEGGSISGVQDLALNGAQIASMVQVVQQAALRNLPRESAVQILARALQMTVAEAEAIVGTAGSGFVPSGAASPSPPPEPGDKPPSPPPQGPPEGPPNEDEETEEEVLAAAEQLILANSDSKKVRSARRRIQSMIEAGELEPPEKRKCVACGAKASQYDHHKGYDHPEQVQPVCASCHNKRTARRLKASDDFHALKLANFDDAKFSAFLDNAEGRIARAMRAVARSQREEWKQRFDEARNGVVPVNAVAVYQFAEAVRERFLSEYVNAVEGELLGVANAGGASLLAQFLFEHESGDPSLYQFPDGASPASNPEFALKVISLAEEATNRMNGMMLDRFTQFARGEKETSLPVLASSTFAAMAHRAVSTAFNTGRSSLMQEVNARAERMGLDVDVTLAERSSVMDGATCGECAQLDGVVVRMGTPKYFDLSPPNKCLGGDRCRCIWSYILPDEDGYLEIFESLR